VHRVALGAPVGKFTALRSAIGLYVLYCWVDLARVYGLRWFEPGFPRGFGLLPDQALSSPWILIWQSAGLLGAALLPFGKTARAGALLAWLWLLHLVGGSHYFYEIQFDYVGWMLIGLALLGDSDRLEKLALWVMGISYSTAGAMKLFSAVWMKGDSIRALLPAGRIEGLDLPIQVATASVALVQLAALPLIASRRTARWGWLLLTVMQVSLLSLFKIEWITIPMLLFHWLAFRREWIPGRAREAAP